MPNVTLEIVVIFVRSRLGDFYLAIGTNDPEEGHARGYHTVAGLVIHLLGRISQAGDRRHAPSDPAVR